MKKVSGPQVGTTADASELPLPGEEFRPRWASLSGRRGRFCSRCQSVSD
jgi:hypothetical protein